jgi:Xaa-Pro aminopeptidase
VTILPPATTPFDPVILRRRLAAAAHEAESRGVDALLVTPSPDYAYLLGYSAPALERLTCLVVRAGDEPVLILPGLELPLARHALGPLAEEIGLLPWNETDDPFQLVRAVLDTHAVRVGVQDQMWARFVLRLQAVLDPVQLVPAGPALAVLRRVKSAAEIDRLRAAAAAADEAMDAIRAEPLSGRSEAEVSAQIIGLLLAAGHQTADFAIVGSGPNSASPHHHPGERLITRGDAVVLDIGGTRDGYCSDTTRTVVVGEPDPAFAELHAVLRAAQAAACDAVRPGITARELDAVARDMISEAGYGAAFFHRTGHGIGMETHEEPYIVSSSEQPLAAGEAFSIEPGIYIEGRWGARIEDIVVCTDDGGERLNTTSTELIVVD